MRLVALLLLLALPSPTRGQLLTKDDRGQVVTGKVRTSSTPASKRARPKRAPSRRASVDDPSEPWADPETYTGRETKGRPLGVVNVQLAPNQVFDLVTGLGRGTMISVPGVLKAAQISDLNRFRVSTFPEKSLLFIYAGRKDTDLVKWDTVRAELFVVTDLGTFIFTLRVAAKQTDAIHKAVYVALPPPPPPTPEEIARLEEERRQALARARAEADERERLEAEKRKAEALEAARNLPVGVPIKRGPLEISVSAVAPSGDDATKLVKLAIRNAGKKAPLSPTIGATATPGSAPGFTVVEFDPSPIPAGQVRIAILSLRAGRSATVAVSTGREHLEITTGGASVLTAESVSR